MSQATSTFASLRSGAAFRAKAIFNRYGTKSTLLPLRRFILIFQECLKSNQNDFFAFRSLQLATKTPQTHPRSLSAQHFRAFFQPNFHQKPPSRSSDATKPVLECSPAEFGVSESSEWHRKLPNRHCKSCLKSNSMYSDKTKSPHDHRKVSIKSNASYSERTKSS